MAVNRRLTKAERWSKLMHDFTEVGTSPSLGFSESFAREWVEIAMIAVKRVDSEKTDIVSRFYGFGSDEPVTAASIAQRLDRSVWWTRLSRKEGVLRLKTELARLARATSQPATTGPLGLFLTEMFAEDYMRKVRATKYVPTKEMLAEPGQYARRLLKHLVPVLARKLGRRPQGSDLATLSPDQVRPLAEFSPTSITWLEDYLHLLGMVLPNTRSVYGMRQEARNVLDSIGTI